MSCKTGGLRRERYRTAVGGDRGSDRPVAGRWRSVITRGRLVGARSNERSTENARGSRYKHLHDCTSESHFPSETNRSAVCDMCPRSALGARTVSYVARSGIDRCLERVGRHFRNRQPPAGPLPFRRSLLLRRRVSRSGTLWLGSPAARMGK